MNLIILLVIGIPVAVLCYFIFLLWWMPNHLENKENIRKGEHK